MSNEFVISSGGSYDTLQAAVDAAQSNDTIFVEAGLYENETAIIDKDLEIVGVNGAAHFRSDGLIDNRKGILVVEGDYDLSVSDLILEGARVGDRNGAGIRFQGERLEVDNVKFVDNEMGILAGKTSDPSTARTLDVTNSVFEDNGGVDGRIGHGIYAFHLGHANIADSHFSGTRTGHHIKSRAFETTIEGNQLLDDNANTSYNIDLPNQGHAVIRNNYIEQSAQSPNLKLINYGGETSGGGLAAKPGSLLVENNAFINYANKGTAVANRTSIDAELIDNAYYNISTRLSGDGSETGGRLLQQPQQVLAVDDEAVTAAGDGVTIDVAGNDVGRDDQPLQVTSLGAAGNGSVVVNGDGTVTYTPDAGFAGTDSFTYRVSDGSGSTDQATVSLDVTQGSNFLPQARDDSGLVAVGGSAVLDLVANDRDKDGDALSITGLGDPAHGSVVLNDDGTVTYRPNAGYLGADGFSYTVSDGQGGSDQGAVDLTVYDPHAAISIDAASLASYGSGQDVEGSATVLDGGATLQLTGNTWKKLPYSYSVSSETMLAFDFRSSAMGELHAIGLETDNDWKTGALPFKVFGTQAGVFNDEHDTYPGDGGWQTYSISVGAHVTGEISHLTFINDHDVASPNAESLFRNVRLYEPGDLNTAPVAHDDAASTSAETAVTIDLLANDDDPDGDLLTVSTLSGASNGVVTNNQDGTVTYTPNSGFSGEDSFTYIVDDGRGGTSEATVTVTVSEPEASGLAFDSAGFSSYGIGQDVEGSLQLLDNGTTVQLTGNIWKQYAHAYQVTADTVLEFEFSSSAQGELHAIGLETDNDWQTGSLPFKLFGTQMDIFNEDFAGYAGDGSWQSISIPVGAYLTGEIQAITVINDHDVATPNGESLFRNVMLYENGGNRAPTANDDAATVLADTAITIDLLANDTDADGDPLAISGLTQPANGSLQDHGDGTVTYSPNAGFTGEDSFTYTVADGHGGSDSATATMSVLPPGDILSFEETGFSSYSGDQDVSGGVNLLDGGQHVELHGNSWKKVAHSHSVTADTVLSFEFRADGLAELHGIGIDTDDYWKNGQLPFLLAGSQQESVFDETYSTYSGTGWQSFSIRLGDHWTGEMAYLTFINDQDEGSADAVGHFRNITLFDEGAAQDMAPDGIALIGGSPSEEGLLA